MAQQKKHDIFREYDATLQAHLDLSKLFSMATNGCPMPEANQGLQGLINKWRVEDSFPRLAWYHCVLHQESLVSKSLKIPHMTKVVITAVNGIKANALNHCKFKKFLQILMLIMVTWSCLLP